MNTNTMELNLNEMELVNGAGLFADIMDHAVGAVMGFAIGGFTGLGAGALVGGAGGSVIGGAVGAVAGGVAGGIVGSGRIAETVVNGASYVNDKLNSLFYK